MVEAERGWGGWGTWLEKDQRGGRRNEEKKGIEREWKEMERRGKSRGGNWETHREVRQAKKEKQLLVAQLNHNTFMFIGNSWLQSLKKGVVSQTCQIGEAAGLLECVKVRRPANLLIWLQENNWPREGKQTRKSSVLGRVHPRALIRATPPRVCPQCERQVRGCQGSWGKIQPCFKGILLQTLETSTQSFGQSCNDVMYPRQWKFPPEEKGGQVA